jgi:ABC-type microcin C transport system duplicated ATPase subunit YejF
MREVTVELPTAAGSVKPVKSGCGKTTLARMPLRLFEPGEGKVLFEGPGILALSGEALRAPRRQMQMIFQDPFASLNPRMRVGEIVAEPLAIHEPKLTRSERRERSCEILRRVGLDDSALPRYPHEFAGGQRQRMGIARALILRPKLIVAPSDVSVGAQVLLLLQELQQEFHLAYVFISHGLLLVAQLATHIAVMRAGQFAECGPAERILRHPTSPYTRELLAAVPEIPRAAKV